MATRLTFRLHPAALARAARRTNRRFVATLAAAALLVGGLFVSAQRGAGSGPRVLVFGYALLAALAAVSYRRRMVRFRARWTTFEIALDDDGVSRTVEGFPPVRLARADVAAVEEGPRGLAVRDRAGRGLLVPRELDGYERLRAALEAWPR
jgi:hypothetical protein